jgi:peptidylprolyl isomerase
VKRLIAILSALCLAAVLVACGGDDGGGKTTTSESGVKVTGDFGKEPKVTFGKKPFSVKKSTDWEAIEGDGETVKADDSVQVHVSLFNGKSGKKLISTLDEGGQALTTSKAAGNLFPVLVDAFTDHKVGSRVVVEAAPEDAYGEQGNPQIKVEANTTVVMVADILKKVEVLDGPKGQAVPPKPGDPKLKLKGDVPSGFDFSGATKPKKLKVVTLIKGEGDPTKKGQTVTVNYLGSEWGSTKVFDASYPRNQTFPVQLGQGGVIKAWDQGLEGVTVGSRILIIAPPALAYGPAGQPPSIGKNATLVFVVDVLGAS